jgi:hypothetical protein
MMANNLVTTLLGRAVRLRVDEENPEDADRIGEIVQVHLEDEPMYTVERGGKLHYVDGSGLRLVTVAELADARRPEAVQVLGGARLACPHCGTEGLDNFYYAEDVTSVRELIRLEGGMLVIQSHYDVCDEGSRDARLGCKKCDRDCAIPDDLEYDWE